MRKASVPYFLLCPLAGALLGMTDARPAEACGAAYAAGSFARLSSERTVIVWDAAAKREHFIRKPTFEGDARDFGFFMPTPTVPQVSKESDALLDRVAVLATPPSLGHTRGAPRGGAKGADDVAVLQTVRIDDFEIVTLKADSADALGTWLGAHGFVDRVSLREWAQRYLTKGWVVSAMRYVAPDTKRGGVTRDAADAGERTRPRPQVDTPTLRFSFAIDTPFYPYTEPQPDPKDEADFVARSGKLGIETRPLFVWLIAAEAVEAFQGNELSGPYLHASTQVSAAELAGALGDTRGWGFDPRTRGEWTVTYLNQFEDRVAREDVSFAPAKVLTPVAAPIAREPRATATARPAPASHKGRWRIGAALLLAAFVALVLVLDRRGDKRPGADT